jgi:hypothetical protein
MKRIEGFVGTHMHIRIEGILDRMQNAVRKGELDKVENLYHKYENQKINMQNRGFWVKPTGYDHRRDRILNEAESKRCGGGNRR